MPYKILNWDKYQSRTDRVSSPWVKLYKDLINSADFYSVPERRRWEWPILLLMSKHHDGIIHGSDADIGFVLYKIIKRKFDPAPFLGRLISPHTPLEIDKEQEQDSDTSGIQSVTSGIPVVTKPVVIVDFEEFWKIWPRKESKANAEKAWKRIQVTPELFNKINKCIDWRRNCKSWKEDGGKYIPYPATWLNQERWNDEKPTGSISVESTNGHAPPCASCSGTGMVGVGWDKLPCACALGAAIVGGRREAE